MYLFAPIAAKCLAPGIDDDDVGSDDVTEHTAPSQQYLSKLVKNVCRACRANRLIRMPGLLQPLILACVMVDYLQYVWLAICLSAIYDWWQFESLELRHAALGRVSSAKVCGV